MAAIAKEKPKRVRAKCEHGKQLYHCVPCGGKGICEHQQRKTTCIQCKGSGVCEHNRIRSQCVPCKGSRICEHERIKSTCKECKGSNICEHGRQRCVCKECGGRSICEHGRYRYSCRECHGAGICEHGKRKQVCGDCGGASLCEHGRQRTQCKPCGGSSYCEHNLFRSTCIICTPEVACQHCRMVYVGGVLSRWKPYCFRCHCVLHPDEEIPRRFRLKEHVIVEAIKDVYGSTLTIICDKKIEGGCSQRRPDLFIDLGSHCVIIEVDENQHRQYSCEEKRMIDLYEDIGFRKVVFLRFNPDAYHIGGMRHPSPFSFTETGSLSVDQKEFDHRMRLLNERIQVWKEKEPSEQWTVEYLCYNVDA